MNDFELHRPASVADATRMFSAASDARYLAGGQSLLPAMKLGLSAPSDLVELSRIPQLKGIRIDGGTVRIGAGSTHAEVAASDAVRGAIPALARLAHLIGDPAVRSVGTIGGSLALNDPAACYPAAVLGLGATVRTDRRTIAADAFFVGMYETALEPGELIVEVSFPVPAKAAWQKFKQPARASRWSACTCRTVPPACAWRSPARGRARSARPRSRPRSRASGRRQPARASRSTPTGSTRTCTRRRPTGRTWSAVLCRRAVEATLQAR
jgi:CO/xanthine dehydrogenase FAD-binding subunit